MTLGQGRPMSANGMDRLLPQSEQVSLLRLYLLTIGVASMANTARTERSRAIFPSMGFEIGKDVFHLVGFYELAARLFLRRKIKCMCTDRVFLLETLLPCINGLEACLCAHFVNRTLRKLGFELRIIPAIKKKKKKKGQK